MGQIDLRDVLKTLKEVHKVNAKREPLNVSFGDEKKCKKLFIEAFQAVDGSIGSFEMLPDYSSVIQWMTDNQSKGLFLMGAVGRGKSVILTGVIPLIFYACLRKVVKPVLAEDMPSHIETLTRAPFLAIDDLGTEPLVNNYGEKYEGFNRLINMAESSLRLVFISTNLTYDQLIDRYGERSMDRVKRLCKIVRFEGKSLRK